MKQTQNFDLAVIGAGPAGLMAAIQAAGRGRKVVLIEKKKNPGRKLLLAGSGRCNLTHSGSLNEFFPRYGGKDRFVKPVLFSFPPDELISFFHERGVKIKELNEGKLFPGTEKSSDILKVLLKQAEKLNISLITDTPIKEIENLENDRKSELRFIVHSESGAVFSSMDLVIAAGGSSCPGTGSSGDGFKFAEELGHSIIPPKPALTSINIPDSPFLDLSGISLKAGIGIFKEGKLAGRASGDLLFTHSGFSGPLILNNSRYLDAGDEVEINFTGKNPDQVRKILHSPESASGGRLVKTLIQNIGIPARLVLRILELAEIPSDRRAAELGWKKAGLIVRLLTAGSFRIESLGGWKEAMVTRGGVDLKEVNPKTMESRIVPGLFFAGEVLDVDGDEGGYNLQFAFSSGYLAGRSAAGCS